MEVGSKVVLKKGLCKGTVCEVIGIGEDEEGKKWIEVVPVEWNGIPREFPEEDLDEMIEN